MAEYLVLTVDEQLVIAEQQLRNAEVAHYQGYISSPSQSDPAQDDARTVEVERLQAEVKRLRALQPDDEAV